MNDFNEILIGIAKELKKEKIDFDKIYSDMFHASSEYWKLYNMFEEQNKQIKDICKKLEELVKEK